MKILAIVEQREQKLKKTAFETARAAAQFGGEAAALVIGDNVSMIAAELGGYGITRVIAVNDPRLALYSASAYAKVAAQVAAEEHADVILTAATAMGRDLAPRLAVRLDAGFAADCVALKAEGNDLIATRPVYAGKAYAEVRITAPVKVCSLRPNVFTAGTSSGAQAVVTERPAGLTDADLASRVTAVAQASGKLDVAEADIIVTGGRGMKGPEHFNLIEDLAGVLGGAVGASRAVVDAGWRPHSEQVGQTGKTVSPSLYVAVGVSGAVQHLAGMSSSKYIVAINKDKDAPIFQAAAYGIVGDAFEVLPAMIAETKKLLGK